MKNELIFCHISQCLAHHNGNGIFSNSDLYSNIQLLRNSKKKRKMKYRIPQTLK